MLATHRILSAGQAARTCFLPVKQHEPAFCRSRSTNLLSAGQAARTCFLPVTQHEAVRHHNGHQGHASSRNGEYAPVTAVDPGSAVDPVHSAPPDPPPSPDPPLKVAHEYGETGH
jgi:hypothetical protein